MEQRTPIVTALAGPNGAGKSTAAPILLPEILGVMEFVNADVIARGLSAFQPEKAAIEAGRIMLKRLGELAHERMDFAFETTLASKTFAPWIAKLRDSGYTFQLLYLWLPNSELAVKRVLDRVRQGGHNVPEETIRRRYRAGLINFFSLYRPIADEWRFFDNADPSKPQLLASGSLEEETVFDPKLWEDIKKGLING